MNKPKVVLADTEVEYIASLQQKFIEEYFGKIELEIISKKDYYQEFFSHSQTDIDILVVSEDLFNNDILRHNIANIFIMTRIDAGEYEDRNIIKLYKYGRRIDDIFYAIVGKSADSLRRASVYEKDTRVITVCSATGGVGKTTIAMGISACLCNNYKRVLYIDAERLQTFASRLNDKNPISSNSVYVTLAGDMENVYNNIKSYIRRENFKYVPPFKSSLMALGIDCSIYRHLIKSAKDSGDYDYIVVDTDSTYDMNKTELIDISDNVIFVTKQDYNSAYAAGLFILNTNISSDEKYLMICNAFRRNKADCLNSVQQLDEIENKIYIDYIEKCDEINISELANMQDIKQISALLM